MFRHEHDKVLEELKSLQTEIGKERERSFQRGFQEGFFISFFLKEGKLWPGLKDKALEKNLKARFERPVEGPQLNLF